MAELLHPTYFCEPFGEEYADALLHQAEHFASTTNLYDNRPDMSVVVASLADTPWEVNRLMNDIQYQKGVGAVETVFANCGNEDVTIRAMQQRGARVIDVAPGEGFRADVLNCGLAAAHNQIVFTTVGHAALSSDVQLRAAAECVRSLGVAGAYGLALPDGNASWVERQGAIMLGAGRMLKEGYSPMWEGGMGLLAADCSVVDRDTIIAQGMYPTIYGAGGADGCMGQKLIENNLGVGRDPLLSVHHTHGLGPVNVIRQVLAWRRMAEPRDWKELELRWHPKGGF
ncbi:MAG TPA: hypothetical protein VF809_03440 [Candidatus Saccharimonadales bacterium]